MTELTDIHKIFHQGSDPLHKCKIDCILTRWNLNLLFILTSFSEP